MAAGLEEVKREENVSLSKTQTRVTKERERERERERKEMVFFPLLVVYINSAREQSEGSSRLVSLKRKTKPGM